MSATSFGYDVSVTPQPVSVTLTIGFSGATAAVTVSNIPDDLDFTLTPSGGFGQQILSQILEPIIGIAGPDLSSTAAGLNGTSLNIGALSLDNVEGLDITPENIALSSFSVGQTAMLELTCSLTVTPASS